MCACCHGEEYTGTGRGHSLVIGCSKAEPVVRQVGEGEAETTDRLVL